MPKLNISKLSFNEKMKLITEFYDVVAALRTKEEIKLFFKDLLSFEEIIMLIQRVKVAVLLKAGIKHEEIKKILKVSNDKINSVHKSLAQNGKGYDLVIKRLYNFYKRKFKNLKKRPPAMLGSFDYLKQKYPQHFLLFNIFDELKDLFSKEK